MWRLDQLWPFRRPKAEEPGKTYYCSIAGPIVCICDECIDLCNDLIAEEVEREEQLEGAASPVASLNAPSWCRVCRLPKPAEEVVAVSDVGFVCHRCADLIRAATDAPGPE